MMLSPKRLILLFGVLFLGLLSWRQLRPNSPAPISIIPMPTEHHQDMDAERRHKTQRKQWIEQMHRAAPGVDWRIIEQANGKHRQQLRAEALASENRTELSLWTETGSRNQAGRMHATTLSASGDSIYGGSSLGGVWKGSLSGDGWRPMSDNLYGGSHGLAVAGGNEGNPEVITSITDQGLINFSDDGGATWSRPAGLPASFWEAKRVFHDPSDPDRVYLMARPTGGMVLYMSNDAGRSYTGIYSTSSTASDFWVDRIVGGDIYILIGNQLEVSHDHGSFWITVGSISQTGISKVVLTASEDGAPQFYAAVKVGSQWTLYSSTNGGIDWSYKYNLNDFWETLCASITNRNLVLFGGMELWRSVNGGSSFAKVNQWWEYYNDPLNKLHADMPGLDCLLTGSGESFFIATDGGLFRSDDGVATVTNISLTGLGVSQYYDTHTNVNDHDMILAGAQDQGYQRSDQSNGNLPRDFEQLISGDYGHITSSDGGHDLVFSVYPGFVLVQSGALNPTLPGMLDFPTSENHSWMPFILANPDNENEFYLCATHLYKGRWLGGNSVFYLPNPQNFAVGGSNFLTAVSISPVDSDHRLVVTDTGRLWYSFDAGETWTDSGYSGPDAHYFYGSTIAHSLTDPLKAWVGGSGYSGPAVYQTQDGGVTWAAMGNRLPSTLVYDLALEGPDNEVLYAATGSGPFRYDDETGFWEYIGTTGVPLTTFWSVESVPDDHLMRFGTYGRGIWDFDVTSPLSGVGDQVTENFKPSLINFPNPFNPRTTLRFNLEKAGMTQVDIFDVAGRHVRRLHSGELARGTHEFVWDGRTDKGAGCPSAVYLAKVKSSGNTESLRITLAK